MDDINIVILSGVIVGTPEVREIGEKKTQLCSGRIQSVRSFTHNGNTRESKTTKNFKAFGNAGKTLAALRAGDRVRITGRLATESWDSKKEQGKKEYREIIEVLDATGETANATQTYSAPKREEEPKKNDTQTVDPEDVPF